MSACRSSLRSRRALLRRRLCELSYGVADNQGEQDEKTAPHKIIHRRVSSPRRAGPHRFSRITSSPAPPTPTVTDEKSPNGWQSATGGELGSGCSGMARPEPPPVALNELALAVGRKPEPWKERAACRNWPDVDDWFPARGVSSGSVRRICARPSRRPLTFGGHWA